MSVDNEHYQLLINNLPGMLYRCLNDPFWTMQFVSQGCKKLTGYEANELLFNKKISYQDLIHPEDQPKVINQVHQALDNNRYWTIEYRIFTRENQIKWVWEQGVATQSGDFQVLEGFITDITESKEQQEQLKIRLVARGKKVKVSQDLLNQYKKAVDASAIVSKTNIDGTITYVNKEFCKVSGYKKQELIGQNHSIVRSQNTPLSVFENLWETINRKEIWRGTLENAKKNGQPYYISGTIVPLLGETGNIEEFMSIRNDVTELILKEQTILEQTTDSNTGLPNRIKLFETIKASESPVHLAIINSPRLREISDFYDHHTARNVSQTIVNQLQHFIENKSVTVFALSYDEFALISQEKSNVESFLQVCHRIIHHFDYNNIQIDDLSIHAPMVMGVASNKNRLFNHAEMALHRALSDNKELVYFNETRDIKISYERNLKWTREVKDAIKEGRIKVFVQPIISNVTESIHKYECLVRMINCDGEVIPPFYFLEVAKKARLYSAITQIVIEKSFQYFSGTKDEFSINISMLDIFHPETVSFLKEKIISYGVEKQIIIEVVESEGIENFDAFTDFISDMKEIGCRIAIDDFGTGYSNFEYLMKLNADMVKIDGSLIKNIHSDSTSLSITKMIVEFAKKLNMKVIAEFVHNKEVLEQVKALRIDFSQGYYFGEPFEIGHIQE